MNLFYKESISKKIGGGGEEGVVGSRWTNRRKGPNQFAPSTSMHKCTSYGPDKFNL